MPLKSKLKDYCEAQNLTQQQLAARTGLSPTTVGQIYRNAFVRLDGGTAEVLCRFFDVQLGDLFYLEFGDD